MKAALKRAAESGTVERLNDGDGLVLLAQPSGVGWWRMRMWRDGAETKLSAGVYPEVSLLAARRKREEVRQQHAAGLNPSEVRKESKRQRARDRQAKVLADKGMPGPGTFEHTGREWLSIAFAGEVSASHAERTKLRLEQFVFPWLGARPIDQIEPPELLQVLRRIEARGTLETAHRVRSAVSQVFQYGLATGVCKRDPAADLRRALRPTVTKNHAAIVDPNAVAQLLRDVDGYKGSLITRFALQLSALLLLRPGELRQLEWAWLDRDESLLRLPAELMKRRVAGKLNGPPHIVPLAPQALAIIDELWPLTGGAAHRRYIFPSLLTAERCMSSNTVNTAIRRLGYDNDTMTAHGFRAMARTLIAERLGVAPEIIEAQLAHTVTGPLGRAYDRTSFLEQRRQMMATWADYLDTLRGAAKGQP